MNIKLFTLISFLLPALVLADGKITNADIYSAAAISFTKMAASTANNVCTFNGSGFIAGGIAPGTSGNVLSSNGTLWSSSSLSSVLDAIGSTQGDILYRGAVGWNVLVPGTAGQILQTGGAAANPSWTNASAPGWSLTGNASTTPGTNFVGTTDANDFLLESNSTQLERLTSGGKVEIGQVGSITSYPGPVTVSLPSSNSINNAFVIQSNNANWNNGTIPVGVGAQGFRFNPQDWGGSTSITFGGATDNSYIYHVNATTGTKEGYMTLGYPWGVAGWNSGVVAWKVSGTTGQSVDIQEWSNVSDFGSTVSAVGPNGEFKSQAGSASVASYGLFGTTGIGQYFPSTSSIGWTVGSALQMSLSSSGLSLGVAGTKTGVLLFNGSTSGTVTMQPSNAAGTWTWTIPATAGTNHYYLMTDGTGVSSWTQPAFSYISGTVAPSQLPNPSASTLGGIESITPGSLKLVDSISTSGVPSQKTLVAGTNITLSDSGGNITITSSGGSKNLTLLLSQTTATTGTVAVPSGVTQVYIKAAGGGGSGSAGQGGVGNNGGGAGGCASGVEGWYTVTAGETLTVTTGSGGATQSGSNGQSGNAGNATTVTGGTTGNIVQVLGGAGGVGGGTGTSGSGACVSNSLGGTGQPGGNGAATGTNGNPYILNAYKAGGTAGTVTSGAYGGGGGGGGSPFASGGNGAKNGSTSAVAGTYGSGGGGGAGASGGSGYCTGAAGGDGRVDIFY